MSASASPPHPVGDPSAYQELLLGYLGADDPAEVQAGTPGRLRQIVGDAGDRVRARPAPGEWSVVECVGHIADAEIVSAARYRWIVAHDNPPLAGYDQDLWVDRLGHADADPAELLDLFEALRTADVAFWRKSSEADRARVGMHEERGPESLDLTFRLVAGHDRFHIDQARRVLDALR